MAARAYRESSDRSFLKSMTPMAKAVGLPVLYRRDKPASRLAAMLKA
jgi:hypothetical protein